MENLSLIDVNKPDVLQGALNELISHKNTEGGRVVTKESLGLENVDNTQDINKPLSIKQKEYVDALITEIRNSVYNKTQVDSLLSQIKLIAIVSELPSEDIKDNTIYLVPLADGDNGNQMAEYVYTGTDWEQIGTLTLDFSNYYNKQETLNLVQAWSPLVASSESGLTPDVDNFNIWIDPYKKKIYARFYDGHALNYWGEITPSNHIIFKDVVITADMYVSDSTYSDYPYRADIPLTGVNSDYVANVVFGVNDALSGDFAPVCETHLGGVSIYTKTIVETTIPTIDILNVYVEGV